MGITIKFFIIGLVAIITDEPPVYTGPFQETVFDVAMIDPGTWEAKHEPELWVLLKYIITCDGETRPCSDPNRIETVKDEKWAVWNLRGKRLRIRQDPKLKSGYEPAKIKGIPSYEEATGNGEVIDDLFEYENRKIASYAIGLRGRLEAGGSPGLDWVWWDQYCTSKPAGMLREQAVFEAPSLEYAIFLEEANGDRSAVVFKPTMIPEDRVVPVHIKNRPKRGTLEYRYGKCIDQHFDMYNVLLEEPPLCRRCPALEPNEKAPRGGECSYEAQLEMLGDKKQAMTADERMSYLGAFVATDALCPPTLLSRPGP